MLEFTDLNILAIIVTWVLSVAVGSFWYSPVGFGKLWSKLSGVDMMSMPQNEATKAITSVVLASLVQVIALAVLVDSLHATSVLDGLAAGLLVWAGFTAATTVGNTLYSRLGWKFWWLNASFFLLVMPINAIILSVWR